MISTVTEDITQHSMDLDVLSPDGKVIRLGRVFWHKNPIVNFIVGGYERWRLERNTRAHNKRYPI